MIPKATPIIVTRGDVDLYRIIQSLDCFTQPHNPYIVWDNSKTLDFATFGRFLAALTDSSCGDLVYCQDDDVIVSSPLTIAAAWEPGKIVCNMPQAHLANYTGSGKLDKLLGFGSCFERALIRPTFARYLLHYPVGPLLLRECDRIFTGLNADKIKLVDVPKTDMPWATDSSRLYRQQDHQAATEEARLRYKYILEREASAARRKD